MGQAILNPFVLNDIYFNRVRDALKRQNIFNGKVKDGFYHGYINKVIANIFMCQNQAQQMQKPIAGIFG